MAEEDSFGKGPSFGKGRGGARHFSKCWVDSGLIYKVFTNHLEILKDLGSYEHQSKTNSPCPKGLLHTMPLWKGLLGLESSGEIHSAPLRTALIAVLAGNPEMNDSKSSGSVWSNLKLERLTCILAHVRKMGKENLNVAAAKLTRDEFIKLQKGLALLDMSSALEKAKAVESQKKDLENAKSLERDQKALEKANSKASTCTALVPYEPNRKLKKENSDASMDANGYPTMFQSSEEGSPQKGQTAKAAVAPAISIARRRPGQLISLEKDELQTALGLGKPSLKRPAAALGKASGKTKSKKKKRGKKEQAFKKSKAFLGKEARKPWMVIRRTVAKKGNQRAYLMGTTEENGKLHLIVEVSQARCPMGYVAIIDEVKKSLEKDSLTKVEALQMREKLCQKWGANW